jgi:hypothetical protein
MQDMFKAMSRSHRRRQNSSDWPDKDSRQDDRNCIQAFSLNGIPLKHNQSLPGKS